jgi:PleD family two-component response regulator
MPEMNGIEFTSSLRESTQVPVILYTNQSEDNVIQEAFDAGVSDYVQKEKDAVHFTLLMRRIKNAVDKHRLEMQVKKDM